MKEQNLEPSIQLHDLRQNEMILGMTSAGPFAFDVVLKVSSFKEIASCYK